MATARSFAGGSFSPVEQDIVRMVASQLNGCDYCVAAHTGSLKAKGLDDGRILDIGRDRVKEPRQAALIAFTQKVLQTKGLVDDEDLADFKKAGFSDAHAAELSVIIAQKTLSNYFNHINGTDLDLPPAPKI